jgi:hypothetical protein
VGLASVTVDSGHVVRLPSLRHRQSEAEKQKQSRKKAECEYANQLADYKVVSFVSSFGYSLDTRTSTTCEGSILRLFRHVKSIRR